MRKKHIYLDNAATTRPSERAISGMIPYFTDLWGLPSAPHAMGQKLIPDIKKSYQSLYALLGASEKDTIVFTSSGAEAVNHALLSCYFDVTQKTGQNHFLVSSVDEAPAMMSLNRLVELGCVATTIPVDGSGRVSVEVLGDLITPRTAMISLSWGNGLTGVIQPVEEIGQMCKERGILLHLEATHILGKVYFDIEKTGADLISFNGDHLHAPKGTGGLWIRSELQCSPFIMGGMEQGGYRAGTYHLPGLIALGIAANEAIECRDLICLEVARLRDRFEQMILNEISDAIVYFQKQERLPQCTTIGFGNIANEALLYLLHRRGVFASIGGGGYQQIGLILAASGVPEAAAHSALSFSLSRETTEEEIDAAVKIIIEAVNQLKKSAAYFEKT